MVKLQMTFGGKIENEKQENHYYHRFNSRNNVFTFTSTRLSINGLKNNQLIYPQTPSILFYYFLKITSGEINGRGTSEGDIEEVVFDVEQELLKGVYERKKELLDTKRWEITEKQSPTQPSFIRNELIDGEITNDVWWEN